MNVANFIRRRIRPEVLDKRFMNSLNYVVGVYLNSRRNKELRAFKELIIKDLMDDIHPLLQRYYTGDADIYDNDEISYGVFRYLNNIYDDIMTDTYKNEIEPKMRVNESKKLLRRFPQEEMEQIFSEALETVTEQLINSRRQNYMMSYLDFRDEVTSLMLIEIRNNYEELYNYYNENEFEFMYFIYKLYGDIIFKRFLDLSKVKKGRNLNEDNSKKDYTKIIKTLIQPYYDKDCVCDIRVDYDEEDDMYGIYIVFSTEELNDMFVGVYKHRYVNIMRKDIYHDIETYFPINNVYVGSYETQTCK